MKQAQRPGRSPVASPTAGLGNLSEEAKETQLQVRRKYAEFHRKLGLLLSDLVEETVYWSGAILEAQFSEAETRFVDTAVEHLLHVAKDASDEDATRNVYRSALYVVEDAAVCQTALQDLRRVQGEVMALTGAKKPYPGLLEPVLMEDVEFVRLRAHRTNIDRVAKVAHFVGEVDKRLVQAKVNAALFETVNPQDDETQRLYKEIAHLETVREKLEQATEAKLLERVHSLRVMARVYRQGHTPKTVYIRNVGLVVTGANVRVEVPLRHRRRRSDHVATDVIQPLVTFDNRSLYSYELWQERVRGKMEKTRSA